MRARRRWLLGVAGAILQGLLAGPSLGQCGLQGGEFATIGGGPSTEKLRIDVAGTCDQGTEVGRFWSAGDSSVGNNFAGGCPATVPNGEGWWRASGGPGLRGIRGVIGDAGCVASSCPPADLVLVVEDWGAAGPPGVGDTAHFVGLRVPADAPGSAANRRWDLARVDNPQQGPASPTVLPMLEHPRIEVLSAENVGGGDVRLTLAYGDVAANVHAVDAAGTALPRSAVVAGYRLYLHVTFGAEPGRLAQAWGEPIDLRPYNDGTAFAEVTLATPQNGADAYLALGLDFVGGTGPAVPSVLVGRALRLEFGDPGVPAPAGAVPDGKQVAGEPLRISRNEPDGSLSLTWSASCAVADFDYEVYAGELGAFGNHEPLTCSTGGALGYTLLPSAGNRYYLVVPVSPPDGMGSFPAEGSYGANSAGEPRPQNPLAACRQQAGGACP